MRPKGAFTTLNIERSKESLQILLSIMDVDHRRPSKHVGGTYINVLVAWPTNSPDEALVSVGRECRDVRVSKPRGPIVLFPNL